MRKSLGGTKRQDRTGRDETEWYKTEQDGMKWNAKKKRMKIEMNSRYCIQDESIHSNGRKLQSNACISCVLAKFRTHSTPHLSLAIPDGLRIYEWPSRALDERDNLCLGIPTRRSPHTNREGLGSIDRENRGGRRGSRSSKRVEGLQCVEGLRCVEGLQCVEGQRVKG